LSACCQAILLGMVVVSLLLGYFVRDGRCQPVARLFCWVRSIPSFLCSVLLIIVCLFVVFNSFGHCIVCPFDWF
jgi:uncharacterized membrane protein